MVSVQRRCGVVTTFNVLSAFARKMVTVYRFNGIIWIIMSFHVFLTIFKSWFETYAHIQQILIIKCQKLLRIWWLQYNTRYKYNVHSVLFAWACVCLYYIYAPRTAKMLFFCLFWCIDDGRYVGYIIKIICWNNYR